MLQSHFSATKEAILPMPSHPAGSFSMVISQHIFCFRTRLTSKAYALQLVPSNFLVADI